MNCPYADNRNSYAAIPGEGRDAVTDDRPEQEAAVRTNTRQWLQVHLPPHPNISVSSCLLLCPLFSLHLFFSSLSISMYLSSPSSPRPSPLFFFFSLLSSSPCSLPLILSPHFSPLHLFLYPFPLTLCFLPYLFFHRTPAASSLGVVVLLLLLLLFSSPGLL